MTRVEAPEFDAHEMAAATASAAASVKESNIAYDVVPTKSYYKPIHGVADVADAHMKRLLVDQAGQRKQVNEDIVRMRQMIQKLDAGLEDIEKPMTEAEFKAQYAETVEHLEEIHARYKDKYSYIAGAGDLFISKTSDPLNVDPKAVKESIARCNSLARSLESVEIPGLDMALTHALEVNVILLRAMHKFGEEASRAGRKAVENMGK